MAVIDWTRLPSLTALRAFDAAARTGGFSQAARTLNVTHAAVAQQVKALEEALDCRLMLRSPRGIELTAEGQVLAARLGDGFAAIALGVQTIRDRAAARPMRITTTAFFAESVIFPRIAGFWAENRGVEIAFTPTDAVIDVVAEGYDLAVRAGGGGWPGLQSAPLVESPTVACAAAHLVDDPETDWTALPWLIPAAGTWERAALRQSGIDPGAITTMDLGDPALEIGACEEGLGLILESGLDLRPHLATGRLKVAPIPISDVTAYFTVLPPWPPREPVRRFRAWLEDVCRTL